MGISRICIKNFKTIDNMDLCLKQLGINCFLGKNGVGKTTIVNAIKYLYKIAEEPYAIEPIIDKKNPYVQKATIQIYYDFSELSKKARNQYIDEKLADFEPYIKDNILLLKMTQYKNGIVEWYPINDVYKIRKILHVFPVYVVNTRDISLYEWSELWEIVCDIAISGITLEQNIVKNNLIGAFQEIYGEKYVKVYELINKIFQEEDVSINERDYKRRFRNAILTTFGGEIFKVNEHNIRYYSAGMNSLKYITLLLKLITGLSATAWKDITIAFDEPEISLHPQYIDELADVLTNYNIKNNLIISTHATHLVSALVRNYANVVYYQVYSVNGYAKIKRIEDIFSEKEKYLIGDEEAASYFADVVVLVEGQTEMQLLRNRNIVKLYPILKKITLYNTESNDSTTRLIIPRSGKAVIPFLSIVDMDKILSYSKQRHKFKIKTNNVTVNPLAKKENQECEKTMFYSNKKRLTYGKRKEINQLLKKEFYSDKSDFYLAGRDYDNLITAIKKYCRMYNCIPLRTTVEGAIICADSLDIVLKWLQSEWLKDDYDDLIGNLNCYNVAQQEVILRCILHGKLDNLLNYNENNQRNVEEKAYNLIQKYCKGEKTDGWVFEFFGWYFENYMVKSEQENRVLFAKTFPEINSILQVINEMIQ